MIAAVFDLDRTLLPGTTAERIFLRYLVKQGLIGAGAAVKTVHYARATGFSGLVRRIRADRPYLIGMHDATLRLHGRRCALTHILPALSVRGLDHIVWHQERDHRIVLLSGSLPYVVEPLSQLLGIRDVICSRMEIRQQRLTGRHCGLHPYGDAKAKLMLEYGKNHNLDLSRSYCYADHHTDESLLQLFGNPICVNPSEKLSRIAQTNGWRIEAFE